MQYYTYNMFICWMRYYYGFNGLGEFVSWNFSLSLSSALVYQVKKGEKNEVKQIYKTYKSHSSHSDKNVYRCSKLPSWIPTTKKIKCDRSLCLSCGQISRESTVLFVFTRAMCVLVHRYKFFIFSLSLQH